MTRQTPAPASLLITGALTLTLGLSACGGSPTADPDSEPGGEAGAVMTEAEQLDQFVRRVEDMDMVEWSGQLLTKAPDDGGRRIFELSGRFSGSTGASQLSMDSSIDGKRESVDYLILNGHTYFNSDAWGPVANDCWADITDKPANLWALPSDLDPTWPVTDTRAVGLEGEGVRTTVPATSVLEGMPRGLFPAVPAGLQDVRATGVVIPHGSSMLEVGVDVVGMWADVAPEALSTIDTKRAGWWSMTMKEALDDSWVHPPTHVFDPAVTPPSQCVGG